VSVWRKEVIDENVWALEKRDVVSETKKVEVAPQKKG